MLASPYPCDSATVPPTTPVIALTTSVSVPPPVSKKQALLPCPRTLPLFPFHSKRRMQLMADEEDEAVRQEADQIRSKIAVLTRNAARLEALASASPSSDTTGGKSSIFHYAVYMYMSPKIFPTIPPTDTALNCTAPTPLLFMHSTPTQGHIHTTVLECGLCYKYIIGPCMYKVCTVSKRLKTTVMASNA